MAFIEAHPKQLWEEEEEDDEAFAHATHVSLSHMLPIVLNAAIELHLFDIISQSGPAAQISPSEIASQIPAITLTNNPPKYNSIAASISMLDRMLQLLATHSLLTWSVRECGDDGVLERLYGLAPAGKYFVQGGGGGSEGGGQRPSFATSIYWNFYPSCRNAWFYLKDAVIKGEIPFQCANGMSLFQCTEIDPTLNQVFNRSMVDISTVIMKKILKSYKGFEGLTSLVNVGGGTGELLSTIVSLYPSIKGINFDLPQVIANAPSYPGIEHVQGDMFSSIPKADAVMMKHILHNWGDEKCLKLLKKCYHSVPKNGKVIIMDIIKPENEKSSIAAKFATQMDNLMLLCLEGKERTENEFKALCKESGFSDYRIVCCAYYLGVIEFYK